MLADAMSVQQSPSRSIIPHALQSRASRVLRRALSRLPPRVQRLGLRALNPVMKRWPPALALLGLAPDDAPPPSSQMLDRAALESAHASAAALDASRLEERLRVLRSSPEVAVRIKVVRALAPATLPVVTAALVAALRDPAAELATEAADALRHHGSEETIQALEGVVRNAESYYAGGVRAAAIRTLSAMLPAGKGACIAAAVADADAEVSLAAIAGLVERDEPGAVEALLAVVENPRGYYVSLTRAAAARGLRRLSTRPDPARVRAVFEREPGGEVREILGGFVQTRPD